MNPWVDRLTEEMDHREHTGMDIKEISSLISYIKELESLRIENEELTKCNEAMSKELTDIREKLEVAMEALISIAFYDEPTANTKEYWTNFDSNKFGETLAFDTQLAREALEKIKV